MNKSTTLPQDINTTQGGAGVWMTTTRMEDILKIPKVRANLLKRCLLAMSMHTKGAKADEHPATRTYAVTSTQAFYRKGGRAMLRVTLGEKLESVTIANDTHHIVIPVSFALHQELILGGKPAPQVVPISVRRAVPVVAKKKVTPDSIVDAAAAGAEEAEAAKKDRAAKDKKNAAARKKRADAKAAKAAGKSKPGAKTAETTDNDFKWPKGSDTQSAAK